MRYRKFGELGFEVSVLGFGAMRLPTDEDGQIIEQQAVEMIRYALDQGVNYVDTAWPYHDGESERLVAKALKDGYRSRTKIATKLPTWEINKKEDMDYYLDRQLEKLGVDKIDCYLLHALTGKRWEKYLKLDVFSWIDKIKKQEKIDYVGFSFHDDLEIFKKIVDDFAGWDFCQIQYNYLDTEFQAGREGLRYAAAKGVPVVVMEPLRGGQLAQDPPVKVKKILNQAGVERTPADLALQWLWNQPEVATVLSGMSNLQQVKENINSASNSGVDSLSGQELQVIDKLSEELRGPIQCTRCNYCMPCPTGVDIPRNFELYNQAEVFEEYEKKRQQYLELDEEKKAEACVRCGQCEPACPQNLGIMDLLEKVAQYFETSH